MDHKGLCILSLKFIYQIILDITYELRPHIEGNKKIIMTVMGDGGGVQYHIMLYKDCFHWVAGSQFWGLWDNLVRNDRSELRYWQWEWMKWSNTLEKCLGGKMDRCSESWLRLVVTSWMFISPSLIFIVVVVLETLIPSVIALDGD